MYGREAREVDVLRMVAECLNNYNNVHLERCDNKPSIHEGVDLEFNEMAPVGDDGLPQSYNEVSDDGM